MEDYIIVFEKCGPTIDIDASIMKINNASTNATTILSRLRHVDYRVIETVGKEECNDYLDYIMEFYHQLTDITVFMHDDGLIPYLQHEEGFGEYAQLFLQFFSSGQGHPTILDDTGHETTQVGFTLSRPRALK
jgi:hypothetical protein